MKDLQKQIKKGQRKHTKQQVGKVGLSKAKGGNVVEDKLWQGYEDQLNAMNP